MTHTSEQDYNSKWFKNEGTNNGQGTKALKSFDFIQWWHLNKKDEWLKFIYEMETDGFH